MSDPAEYEKVCEAYNWVMRRPGRSIAQAIERSGLDAKTFWSIWPHVAPGGGVNSR